MSHPDNSLTPPTATSRAASEPTLPRGNPSGDRPETAEEWEQVRRSVAMLPPGAWAMRREQSLHALAALLATLRQTPKR